MTYEPQQLLNAICTSDLTVVSHLLKSGIDPSAILSSNDKYPTAFHSAIHSRNLKMIELLCPYITEDRLNALFRLPFLGFDSPLHYAVSRLDVQLVRLLLEKGADPNFVQFERGGVSPLCSIPCFVVESEENSAECTRSIIISILLDHGASLSLPTKSGDLPIHYVASLAASAPDAADLMIQRSDPILYDFESQSLGSSQNVLTAAVRVLTGLISGLKISNSTVNDFMKCRIHRILNHAILPLIRNGAVLQQSVFNSSFDVVRIALSCNLITNVTWNFDSAFIYLLIAMRQSSKIDVSKLPSFINPRFKDDLVNMTQIIKKSFPLSLQDCCRFSILQHLPRGPNHRTQSIKNLQLPNSLVSYLLFEEFNVIKK